MEIHLEWAGVSTSQFNLLQSRSLQQCVLWAKPIGYQIDQHSVRRSDPLRPVKPRPNFASSAGIGQDATTYIVSIRVVSRILYVFFSSECAKAGERQLPDFSLASVRMSAHFHLAPQWQNAKRAMERHPSQEANSAVDVRQYDRWCLAKPGNKNLCTFGTILWPKVSSGCRDQLAYQQMRAFLSRNRGKNIKNKLWRYPQQQSPYAMFDYIGAFLFRSGFAHMDNVITKRISKTIA